MRTTLKYLTAGALATLIASPALADDSPRFSADDFLSKYNLLLEEDKDKDKDETLKVNLDEEKPASDKKDDEFVYFNTQTLNSGNDIRISLQPTGKTQSTFTARKSTFSGPLETIVMPSPEAALLSTFTPRYTSADITFGIGGSKKLGDEDKSTFDISFSSQISSRSAGMLGGANNAYAMEALNSQVYDFGMNVGYSGFHLGASIRGEEGAFYDGVSGYDVGLSYDRPTWSTSILFGEYRQGNSLLIGALDSPYLDTRFFALEFGAAYKLSPGMRFVGSFRFYEDPTEFLFNHDSIVTSQMFYLGTRLSF